MVMLLLSQIFEESQEWDSTGRDVDTLADHIDVLTTLAYLCKLSYPDKSYDVDGLSLNPLLAEKQVRGNANISSCNSMAGLAINLLQNPSTTRWS